MLIARRIRTAYHPRPDVKVWRVEDQGHGIEAMQYIERIDHGTATAESALTAAGYTIAGPWQRETENNSAHERMPLTADARGFIMRMLRLHVRPGPCHATDPEAAGIVQSVLARLLTSGRIPADVATLPAHYHQVLRAHLAELNARATQPPQPGRTPPDVNARAAAQLARILRTLETEFAESF